MKLLDKIVKIIASLVGHMGAYFMITVLFLTAVSGEGRGYNPAQFGVAVLFSALLALSSLILKIKIIKSVFAVSAIHVVAAVISFVVSFVLVYGQLSASTAFVAAVCFMVVDIIALVIRGVYVTAKKKHDME